MYVCSYVCTRVYLYVYIFNDVNARTTFNSTFLFLSFCIFLHSIGLFLLCLITCLPVSFSICSRFSTFPLARFSLLLSRFYFSWSLPLRICVCVCMRVISFFRSTAYTSNRILYLSSTYFVHIVIPIANRCSFSFSHWTRSGWQRGQTKALICSHIHVPNNFIWFSFLFFSIFLCSFFYLSSLFSISLRFSFSFERKKIISFFNFKLRNSIGCRNTELKLWLNAAPSEWMTDWLNEQIDEVKANKTGDDEKKKYFFFYIK